LVKTDLQYKRVEEIAGVADIANGNVLLISLV
jgi:hypothetical protein